MTSKEADAPCQRACVVFFVLNPLTPTRKTVHAFTKKDEFSRCSSLHVLPCDVKSY